METSDIIVEHLYEGNIAHAIEMLTQYADQYGNWDVKNALEKEKFAYNAMLDFVLQNHLDDDAKAQKSNITRNLLNINFQLERLERCFKSPDSEYSIIVTELGKTSTTLEQVLTLLVEKNMELKDLLENHGSLDDEEYELKLDVSRKMLEKVRKEMFQMVWTSGLWTSGDYQVVYDFINNENAGENNICILISALTLSVCDYLDQKKVNILFDGYLSSSRMVSMRSIVGIYMTICFSDDIICKFFPELKELILNFCEDEKFMYYIMMIATQLAVCSKTDSVTSKLYQEIMDSYLSNTMDMIKEGMHDDEDSLIDMPIEYSEENMDLLEKEVGKNITDLNALYEAGADYNLFQFSTQKKHAFFSSYHHWFYPFDFQECNVSEEWKKMSDSTRKVAENLIKLAQMCDNDKYSLFFSICFLRNDNVKFDAGNTSKLVDDFDPVGSTDDYNDSEDLDIIGMIGNHLNDVHIHEVFEKNSDVKIIRNYICDLYRFFIYSSIKYEVYTPFVISDKNTMITDYHPYKFQVFEDVNIDTKTLCESGKILMDNHIYPDASQVFESADLDPSNPDNFMMFLQMGFCYEKQLDFDHARLYLKQAYEINNQHKWLIEHLAYLEYGVGESKVAYDMYSSLSESYPQNTKYIICMANCARLQGHFEEALRLAYKAQYLDSNNRYIDSMLAELLFINGKYDKCAEIVIGSKSVKQNILGALVFVMENNYVGACEMLKIAWDLWAKKEDKNKEDFRDIYQSQYMKYTSFVNMDVDLLDMIYDAMIMK